VVAQFQFIESVEGYLAVALVPFEKVHANRWSEF
jgi:hypothetical protein